MQKAATIYDVVRESGLSKATVYRVVYGKGPVSEESRKKVSEAIEKLHYTPNEFATSLAVRKARHIVCVTPEYSSGSYWERIHQGFVEASASTGGVEVKLECLVYCETDAESFRQTCEKALGLHPDGMVLGLQFESIAKEFVLKLQYEKIPYVLIDNIFKENGRLAFYGVDFYNSGKLAAFLLADGAPINSCLLIRLRRDRDGFSDPTKLRREGFASFFAENNPSCVCHTLMLDGSDAASRESVLGEFFATHPEVRHAAVMNSRTYFFTDFLAANPIPDMRVVGFDDIPHNIKALKSGYLTFLLAHHQQQQASMCIKTLCAFLTRGELPAERDNYMHIDILSRYNAE